MAKVDVGDRAPNFELPGTGDKTYRLSDYRGRLAALDADVLGISPQSVDSHEHWVKEQELNVPLLADEDLAVAKSYGVTGWLGPLARFTELNETPGGRYVMRAIFVIDGEGIVRYRQVSRTGSTYESV